ncbi:MAG: hypothetical protein K5829_09525 [Treponema sp.]|nr:hypothetical protein [Treponema sp.]
MADNSEEISVINHLLKVEKEAYVLIDDAMKDAEAKVSSARVACDAEFREKYSKALELMEQDYNKNLETLTTSHDSILNEYKAKITGQTLNKTAFNELLDKLLFPSEQ